MGKTLKEKLEELSTERQRKIAAESSTVRRKYAYHLDLD